MPSWAQIAAALVLPVVGWIGKWAYDLTRKVTELKALADAGGEKTPTPSASTNGPSTAQLTREMHSLLKEWDRHYWEKLIKAMENANAASADVARAIESQTLALQALASELAKGRRPRSSSG